MSKKSKQLVVNKTPEVDITRIPTVNQFCDTLPENIHELYFFGQFGGDIIDRCNIGQAKEKYGTRRVLNYFDRDDTDIREVYLMSE